METLHENTITTINDQSVLTDSEIFFLQSVQEIFQNVISSHKGFDDGFNNVRNQLYEIVKDEYNSPTQQYYDIFVFKKQFDQNKQLLKQQDNSVSDNEIQFANDVIKAIKFFINNGISFGRIANTICHDFSEVYKHGSVDQAMSMCFQPKIKSWAEYNEYNVGDPDEPEDF